MQKVYRALVCCRAGMGSSTLLKIKADQVISANHWPIETEHGNLDSLMYFKGDLIITMSDLTEEIQREHPDIHCVGINSIVNKEEMKTKLAGFLRDVGEDPDSFN